MMQPGNRYESVNPELSDIAQHRARVYEALSRHSDPVLREIGRQLAGGEVAPHELLSEPRYVEALQRGAQRAIDLSDQEAQDRFLGGPKSAGARHGTDAG